MNTTLIIGAGGVGRVVVHKCVQNADVFGKIVLASRSIGRCEEIKNELPDANIIVDKVDADVAVRSVVIVDKSPRQASCTSRCRDARSGLIAVFAPAWPVYRAVFDGAIKTEWSTRQPPACH